MVPALEDTLPKHLVGSTYLCDNFLPQKVT